MKNILALIGLLGLGPIGFQFDNSIYKTIAYHLPVIKNDTNTCAPGFVIQNQFLKARIVDNSKRYFGLYDTYLEGMNGIAVLMQKDQHKNIFSTVGMNLESTHTDPKYGQFKDAWNAPRLAPMKIEQIDSSTVKFTQKAVESSGLNFEIIFSLQSNYIDQTITFWPDVNIQSSTAFFASYMNLVQNTSLYLRTPINSKNPGEWLEVVSAGHGANGEIFAKAIHPNGLKWNEFNKGNPLFRQSIEQSPGSREATIKAGYSVYNERKPDHFWFGFVDDYMLLMIFKEPVFNMWISASGGMSLRCPAWDYAFNSGPQKAFEKRTYHVRAVYKKFEGVDAVLKDVQDYLKEN